MNSQSAAEEGVTKYRARHVLAPAVHGARLAELVQARDQLWDAGLVGLGADGIAYGNVSVRFQNEAFLISGTQTGGARRACAEDFSLVLRCRIERNEVQSRGPCQPSSEAMTHYAFYAADPAVGAVVHVHHAGLWQAALHRLPTTPPAVQYGTVAMAEAIAELCARGLPAGCVVMGGHRDGLCAIGTSPLVAAKRMLALLRQHS